MYSTNRHDTVDKEDVDRFIIHMAINYDMPFYDHLLFMLQKIKNYSFPKFQTYDRFSRNNVYGFNLYELT